MGTETPGVKRPGRDVEHFPPPMLVVVSLFHAICIHGVGGGDLPFS